MLQKLTKNPTYGIRHVQKKRVNSTVNTSRINRRYHWEVIIKYIIQQMKIKVQIKSRIKSTDRHKVNKEN